MVLSRARSLSYRELWNQRLSERDETWMRFLSDLVMSSARETRRNMTFPFVGARTTSLEEISKPMEIALRMTAHVTATPSVDSEHPSGRCGSGF